jgi:hypothetical protein
VSLRELCVAIIICSPSYGLAQTAADYTVYSATLDGAFSDRTAQDSGRASRFVIRDSTEAKGLVTAGLKTEFMRRQFGFFSSAYQGTLDDFISRNQTKIRLGPKAFTAKGTVEVVTRRDLPSADDPDRYWPDFYRKFPGARELIAFSRPGFDKDRRYALVYFHTRCGNLCGERGYVLLRQLAGRWIVVRRVVTMMS